MSVLHRLAMCGLPVHHWSPLDTVANDGLQASVEPCTSSHLAYVRLSHKWPSGRMMSMQVSSALHIAPSDHRSVCR